LLPNEEDRLRIGITASKAVGSAVDRNRAKRRLRAVMDALIPQLPPGWDVVLVARKPAVTAHYNDLTEAVMDLLSRTSLIVNSRTKFDD
jgi:ribonuclease P protein component